jgi:hypothetical protein
MGLKIDTRAEVRIAGIVLSGMLSISGCVAQLQATATQRASRELACPETQLSVVNRYDIDDNLFDVSGCGRAARYMCIRAHNLAYCVREPNPDPKEQAARNAAPPPPALPLPTSNDKATVNQKDNPFGGN